MSQKNSNNQVPVLAKMVSGFIVIVFLAQAAEIFARTSSHAWPFTNYPMYATPHYENERLDSEYRTYAIFEDGSEHLIDEEDLVEFNPKAQQLNRENNTSAASGHNPSEKINYRSTPGWRPCALSRSGQCVLFRNYLSKSILKQPNDTYSLNQAMVDDQASVSRDSWFKSKIKPYVSRKEIVSQHIDIFTRSAEKTLGRTIVQYRVEDYPARLTKKGWETGIPANVLKVLHIKR